VKLFKFFSLVLVLAIAGCGAVIKPSKPQLVAEPDKTALMIADSADRATRALESLAAVEQSKNPAAPVAAMVPDAPPELQRAVTFSWAGPIEPVAKDIAARAGYSFNTVGDVPPAPIYVTISAYNQPLIEVLRDLGLQMGARADLKLDANARVVEIIYAPTVNHEKPVVKTMSRKGRKE
jgi:defect in organelle trafficking protein DotD